MTKTGSTTIAKAVRARRMELGLTQAELAERADITSNTVRNVEAGRGGLSTERRRTLMAIFRALGWPSDALDQILEGQPPPEASPDLEARIEALERSVVSLHAAMEELRDQLRDQR